MKKYGLIGVAILCMCFIALGFSLQGTQLNAQTKGEICDNGIDDDGDKLVDCADSDCTCNPPSEEICDNGIDDDGDKLVDCADSDCTCEPPSGPPCSPGWWKQTRHADEFAYWCTQVSGWTCDELWEAITCKGSEAGCTGERRQAAATALNDVSDCTE